ncbi:hypothetical protein [Marinobacter sediminum]|uniref:hypothetical protein n=1 Tax=Marinobacter sediminum TaxID=256323 RepID=UPI003567A850
MKRSTLMFVGALSVLPLAAAVQADRHHDYGPESGDREFSLSATGGSDRDFDNSSIGLSGDLGWYLQPNVVVGIRQSANYADIEGESASDDFWNGSTRGYADYQFGHHRFRPLVGASLGAVYGDAVKDSGFAGLEAGAKYYVLPKTYLLGRAEYQWFFDSSSDSDDNFDDGAWVYTVGIGFNF